MKTFNKIKTYLNKITHKITNHYLLKLLSLLFPAKIATNIEEKNNIYKLRYDVYINEMGLYEPNSDHNLKIIHDKEDDEESSYLLYINDGGKLAAILRLNYYPAGTAPERILKKYELSQLPNIEKYNIGELSRFIIAPNARKKFIMGVICRHLYELGSLKLGIELYFATCAPGLIHAYKKIGFLPYSKDLYQYDDRIEIKIMGIASDRELFKTVNVPFIDQNKVFIKKHSRFSANDKLAYKDIHANMQKYFSKEKDVISKKLKEHQTHHIKQHMCFISKLSDQAINLIAAHSFMMKIDANYRILAPGENDQEIFIILDGNVLLTSNNHKFNLGEGDIFGEIPFFLNTKKSCASVTTVTETYVLVIQRSFLSHIAKNQPQIAYTISFCLGQYMANLIAEEGLST